MSSKTTFPDRSAQPAANKIATNPYLGENMEFETARFDAKDMRPYKYHKMKIPRPQHSLNMKGFVNFGARDIK